MADLELLNIERLLHPIEVQSKRSIKAPCDSPDSYRGLVSDIRSTTRSIEPNHERSAYLQSKHLELLAASRDLVPALESPDTPLWRVIFAVRDTLTKRCIGRFYCDSATCFLGAIASSSCGAANRL